MKQQQSTRSLRGMVTSPHTLASQSGLQVLAGGGNAIEAAIATVVCLCVSHPHFCGLGGDALMLVADPSGAVQSISGIGQAAGDISGYGEEGQIATRGARACLTSAGLVDALGEAFALSQRQGGRRRWSELLAPAIALAHTGYAVSASELFWLQFRLPERAELADVYRHFGSGDPQQPLPPAGMVRRQPELARSLESLAARGPRDFYEGELAQRLAQGLEAAGSPLRASDLARTRARIESPLAMDYRGGELLSLQPPSQGMSTLQAMGLLQRMDLQSAAEGSAQHYHCMVEAIKRAFLDRNRFLGDPDFGALPLQRLLSGAHLDAGARAIHPTKALPWPHAYQSGDTVYVGVADAMGNAVSLLATVYYDWGSGVLAGDTGIVWHNRGAAFSLQPGQPNTLAPGKRPFHTLNPGMYRKNGRVQLLYGTQGADGQPQTLVALLTRLIDYGMEPLQALAQPRFLLGKTFSDSQDALKLEDDVPEDVVAELRRFSHRISLLPAQNALMGHPGVISLDPHSGWMTGAHDPRSDGLALGL